MALSIILLITLLFTISYAWFFFPNAQTITIYTDTDHEIDVELYTWDQATEKFVKSQADDGQVVASSPEGATFIEWGGVFYQAYDMEDYYILILTYPDSNFTNGYLEASIRIELLSGFNQDLEANTKILFTSIEYAVGSDADLDPDDPAEQNNIISTMRNAQYTELFLGGIDYDYDQEGMDEDFMADDELSILFSDLDEDQYVYRTLEDVSNRLVIYIRVKSDETHIAESVENVQGGLHVLQMKTANLYRFTASFRSVPYKPLEEGDLGGYLIDGEKREKMNAYNLYNDLHKKKGLS